MRSTWIVALTLLLASPAAWAQATPRPATLEECYLDLAARKGTADAVHLAREVCDAVFGRAPRSLSIYSKKTKECVEWWFDAEGRYESAEYYCSLEASGERTWKLACQWKTGSSYTFAQLRENQGRLELVGELKGKGIGTFFTSLGACIEHRANSAGG